jgi:hypothetical protein
MKFLAATAVLLVLLAACTRASAETSSRRLLQQSTARASAAAISAGPGGVSAAYASAEATSSGGNGGGGYFNEAGCPNPSCPRCAHGCSCLARHICSHPFAAPLRACHLRGPVMSCALTLDPVCLCLCSGRTCNGGCCCQGYTGGCWQPGTALWDFRSSSRC